MSATHDILATTHRHTLEQFARANVLIGFDYDGTLAPIVSTPASAHMRQATRHLLYRVARAYPCAVISGRALDDVAHRLHGLHIRGMFGNHGLEPPAGPNHDVRSTRSWLRSLQRRLADYPGVMLEDKRHSLTIHYRRARCREQALAAIEAAVGELTGVRRLDGLETINLLPAGGPNKGVALQRALRQAGCDKAIFVGDDVTDEDAFAAGGPDRLLPIRIGRAPQSKARYFLESQLEIDAFLQTLLDIRATSASGPAEAGHGYSAPRG